MEHPEHLATLEATVDGAFPRFLLQDPIWDACWPRILEAWPELQVFVVETETSMPVAMVNAVAFPWDGTADDLPAGTHRALQASLAQRDAGERANTACAIQGVIDPSRKGGGLGGTVMGAFISNARSLGHEHAVSPIRPTSKQDYPTVPLDRYVTWENDDGEPLDPWLRVQTRIGGERLQVCEDSLVIEGSVAEWEEWTGLRFRESGDYVIEGGHVPVSIVREEDRGRYSEPHVWFDYPAARIPNGER